MSQSSRPISAAHALANSEEFNDPSLSWHISRQQMAATSVALNLVIGARKNPIETFKTSSGKWININHYQSKGEWIQ